MQKERESNEEQGMITRWTLLGKTKLKDIINGSSLDICVILGSSLDKCLMNIVSLGN